MCLKCDEQLKIVEKKMEDDEGGDDKANLIREMIVQLIISREHRKRIKEIEDNLEGRKDCSKLRDARDILSGTKKCEVPYTLTKERYVFERVEGTIFVLKYRFNDGKISVESQLKDESVIVDGESFTGHGVRMLRKPADEANLIAVAQAEIKLKNSVQTQYDKTVKDIARLMDELHETDINDEERRYNLGAKMYDLRRLLGEMKKGKHKAEMPVSAYTVRKLDDLIESKSADFGEYLRAEVRAQKMSEMNMWKKLPDMETARGGLGVAFGDGKLFAVGGYDNKTNFRSVECLDLSNSEARWEKLRDMKTARSALGVAFGDGKLFAVGGWDGGGGTYLRSVEYLDLRNSEAEWEKLPDMETARGCLGVAFGNGKLFAVGGWENGTTPLRSVEYLDLSNSEAKWEKLPDVETARGGLGVAFGDGKLFAVGGCDNTTNFRSVEYLDLSNLDAGWKKLPDMENFRVDLGVAFGGGKLFAVGGRCTDAPLPLLSNSVECLDLKNVEAECDKNKRRRLNVSGFDSSRPKWEKTLPDMSFPRRQWFGVAFGDGKLFVVGGSIFKDFKLQSGEYIRIAM